jgi:D,D-heptose 1,7-bisphosphate phosphatase
MIQAVILAGGKGTRLKERLHGLPKPLIDICGMPLLERQILLAKQHGIDDILILVSHEAARISEFCERNANWGIRIRCIDDGVPRGTAGAVLSVLDELAADVLVIYGDTMLDVDFGRFKSFHDEDPGVAATILVHPNDHPQDSDLVETSAGGLVTAFHPYPHDPSKFYSNQVSAALYFIRPKALQPWRLAPRPLDFGKDLFPAMLQAGLRIRSYNSPEYIKDAGTPSRLDKVCADLSSGKISRASFNHPQKAVFLDRDGCINIDHGHIDRPERFELIEGSAAGIAKLNKSEFRTLVITNQPVIARGDCTLEGLKQIHNKMETELGRLGAFVDAIYVCPHHPDGGFIGEVPELKRVCDCRKPGTALIDQASLAFNIDRSKSWMVGDSTSDALTAKRAGIRSIILETGAGGLDAKHPVSPNYTAPDLRRAAAFIVEGHDRLLKEAAGLLEGVECGDTVLIGGLSRSGKSFLASAISEVLAQRGIDSVVLGLDRWLLPAERRTETVVGRYDGDGIRQTIDLLARASATQRLSLPYYDRINRKPISNAETIDVPLRAVRILDGTVALTFMDCIPKARLHTIFVEIGEDERRRRVLREYAGRGFSQEDAALIYKSRQHDEFPVIQSTSSLADRRISIESTFQD